MINTEIIWLVIGFSGQALFSMRFIAQWIASEKQKKSIIPVAFWYFSIAGGITLLSYALYKQDPVFILGQAMGLFIYARNLYFIFRDRKLLAADTGEKAAPHGGI
ncbi:MAG: lipid-A-disaccharide synthase N-terminal domain-containing protein [Gammaproteobacteria bacterium]|nr:lipid-A-disaccharide synthase N-terminal domain-containing protein [Gammaproteobacteria bacterium]